MKLKELSMPSWGNEKCKKVVDAFNADPASCLSIVLEYEEDHASMSDIVEDIDVEPRYNYIFPETEAGKALEELVKDTEDHGYFLEISSEDCFIAEVIKP